MNQVILNGRLTKAPELRKTTDDKSVGTFFVAVRRTEEATDFIKVTVFGKTAENAFKFLEKGSRVLINGRIQTGKYEKDGKTTYTMDVIGNNVEFFDWKDKNEEENTTQTVAPEGFQEIDEDIPF